MTQVDDRTTSSGAARPAGQRVVDLTLPLYDNMPVGSVQAWDVPFRTEPIVTRDRNGFEIWMVTMHTESGTRFMMGSMTHRGATVDQVALDSFVMRPTAVVKLPADELYVIGPEDIDRAFAGADLREGDAILLHTGWADDGRWYEMKDDFTRRSPGVSAEGAARLVEIMKANKSDLVGIDVANWGTGDVHMKPLWSSKPAWERDHFPGQGARRFLQEYTPDMSRADWTSPAVLADENMFFIGTVCNLGSLRSERVDLTVLPMKIEGAPGAPCRVVAIER
jgi:kynurenine formamidase